MKTNHLNCKPEASLNGGIEADTPSEFCQLPAEPSKLALVTRKVVDLIRYSHNPRTHSEAQIAQIAASIAEFGFTNPVLIDDPLQRLTLLTWCSNRYAAIPGNQSWSLR